MNVSVLRELVNPAEAAASAERQLCRSSAGCLHPDSHGKSSQASLGAPCLFTSSPS